MVTENSYIISAFGRVSEENRFTGIRIFHIKEQVDDRWGNQHLWETVYATENEVTAV